MIVLILLSNSIINDIIIYINLITNILIDILIKNINNKIFNYIKCLYIKSTNGKINIT